MLAILRKEFRQLIPVTVLPAVMVPLVLAFALYGNNAAPESIVGYPFQMIAASMFALVGAGLGLVGLLPDLRRGHFGFAVHRPVPRSRLLLGKYLGAAAAYATVCAASFVAIFFCATNQRFVKAPFIPSMFLPMAVWSLSGFVWIAAGQLIAARQARWLGSRLFPIVVPIIVVAGLWAVTTSLAEAFAYLAVAVALFVIVAVAYFKTNGRFDRQPLFTRWLSGGILLTSVGCLLGVSLGIASELLGELAAPRRYGLEQRKYIVDGQGNVRQYDLLTGQFRDTDGRPLGMRVNSVAESTVNIVYLDRTHPNMSMVLRRLLDSRLDTRRYLERVWVSFDSRTWVFVPSRGTFAVIDRYGQSHETVGKRETDAGIEPFEAGAHLENAFSVNPLVVSPQAVYRVTPGSRQAERILTADKDHPLIAAATNDDVRIRQENRGENPDTLKQIAVGVAKDRLYVRQLNAGGPTRIVPLPDIGPSANLEVSIAADDKIVVLVNPYGYGSSMSLAVSQDRDGRVTQQTLRPIDPPTTATRWPDFIPLLAMPPIAGLASVMVGWTPSLNRITPAEWLTMVLTTAAAVAWTIWLTRRCRLNVGQRVTWIGMAALGGVAIPLTLLLLRERPARVPCPTCGKKRPVDADRCPHCGNGWPTPGDAATNVFEDREAA